jgi:hypothetical protein
MNQTAANAQAAIFECSVGGQNGSAPFIVDAANKTVSTSQESIPIQVIGQTLTWPDGGGLRMLNTATGMLFRRLPDGSYFQIGECRGVEKKL